MLELLEQVIQLATQAYHCKTTTLILFVVRLTVHVESAMAFLLQLQGWPTEHGSISLSEVPALKLSAASYEELKRLFGVYQERLHYVREVVLLERWLAELTVLEEEAQRANRERVDELCRDMCTVNAHVVLTLRNTFLFQSASSWDGATQERQLRTLLTTFLFLTRRHTWNKTDSLGVCEVELWEIMDKVRGPPSPRGSPVISQRTSRGDLPDFLRPPSISGAPRPRPMALI